MIRVALIDAGCRVDDYLSVLPRLTRIGIAAIVDAHAPDEACARLGAEIAASSLDQLLENHDQAFDAVVIHSPPQRRAELVCRAAQAGKHAMVDSPMALSVQEAETAISACQSAGVRLMVAQPTRFMPFQQTVRQSLVANKLGAPGLLRIHRWMAFSRESSEKSQCQDVAMMSSAVIREVDLACWFFDALPSNIFAVHSRAASGTHAVGVQIHLGFPAGGMALIDCMNHVPSGDSVYYSLTLIGAKGAVYADDHHNLNLAFYSHGTTTLDAGTGQDHQWLELEEFADALQHDRQPICTGEDGKRAIAVTQAVVDSMASRRAAQLVGEHYELG